MVRSFKRVFFLVAALLVATHFATADTGITLPTAGHAPQRAEWKAACMVGLRCPNGQVLTCPGTPCSALDNCGIRCEGHVVRCTGVCIIE
jgi:hypothetical protein